MDAGRLWHWVTKRSQYRRWLPHPRITQWKYHFCKGLIGTLRKVGHIVAPFEVGLNFIGLGYHTVAASRPGRNLDSLLVGGAFHCPVVCVSRRWRGQRRDRRCDGFVRRTHCVSRG